MLAEIEPATTAKPLKISRPEPGIVKLTLSRPPANTLSQAMLNALQSAFDDAEQDTNVRVIIVAAEGRLFCAGHDLKEMTARRSDEDKGRAFFADTMGQCARVMQAIVNHPKPVIAEVGGLATGAGCQLVASCDLVIASDEATFCTPGVHIGLFCSTPMVALSRTILPKHAMEMLLTGEAIDASVARQYGLVNRVAPKDYVEKLTLQYARNIAAKSSLTLKTGKQAFYRQLEMGLSEAYEYTSKVMTENMLARDAEEGLGAFIEHRDPVWTDE